MVGRGRKNTTKPKETLEKNKINQLEQTETAKISNNNLEEDNESVNIKQNEPKKIRNKIDSHTLASTYFSSAFKIGNDQIGRAHV